MSLWWSLVVVAQGYPPDAIWRETRFPSVLPLQSINQPTNQPTNQSISLPRELVNMLGNRGGRRKAASPSDYAIDGWQRIVILLVWLVLALWLWARWHPAALDVATQSSLATERPFYRTATAVHVRAKRSDTRCVAAHSDDGRRARTTLRLPHISLSIGSRASRPWLRRGAARSRPRSTLPRTTTFDKSIGCTLSLPTYSDWSICIW